VDLDESHGEANGAAYLVHMLLSQKAEADKSGAFAKEARRLKPVRINLTDTGESAIVAPSAAGLMVTSELQGRQKVTIVAESRHIIAVTKVRLAGRWLITGPFKDKKFRGLVGDIAVRKVRIGGLVSHYASAMRFLWLVNLRNE
jgi:hypothetical protein